MPDSAGDITLYRLHGCPYCERIAAKLKSYDIPYESRFVPAEHSRRDVVKRISGTRSVPMLVDANTGVTMAESERISAYLDREYGEAA